MNNWRIWLAVILAIAAFGWAAQWQPELVVGQNQPLECGWSCDGATGQASCKANQAGDTYEWIGYCADGSTGICQDECTGSIDGNVQCGGESVYLSCPSETKTSVGCCSATPPANSPQGVIEGWTTCERAIGWAYDSDETDASESGEIKIEIYVDDQISPTVTGSADLERADKPNGWTYVGFDIPLPELSAGEHVIYAKGLNLADGSDTWLGCWSRSGEPGLEDTPNQCDRGDGSPGDGVTVVCGSQPSVSPTPEQVVVEPPLDE